MSFRIGTRPTQTGQFAILQFLLFLLGFVEFVLHLLHLFNVGGGTMFLRRGGVDAASFGFVGRIGVGCDGFDVAT